jgi:hypothetical protein
MPLVLKPDALIKPERTNSTSFVVAFLSIESQNAESGPPVASTQLSNISCASTKLIASDISILK